MQVCEVLLKEDEKVAVSYDYPAELAAPVKKDSQVGEAVYRLNGMLLASYPLRAEDSIQRIDYGWCLEKCSNALCSLPVLIILHEFYIDLNYILLSCFS